MYNNGKFGSDEPVAVVKLVLATTSKMRVLVRVYWNILHFVLIVYVVYVCVLVYGVFGDVVYFIWC